MFLIKWKAPWRRINFDLHRVFGFYLAPVVFIIALTGAVFTFHWIAVPFIYWVTSSTPVPHGATVKPVEGAIQVVQAAGDHVPNSVATGLAMPQFRRVDKRSASTENSQLVDALRCAYPPYPDFRTSSRYW